MDLIFDFDPHRGITNVRFVGLDGTEDVRSVKEALGLMRIRNPAMSFTEAVKTGTYDDLSDEDYARLLKAVEYLSFMWRCQDEPGESPRKREMNALTLLANALEALGRNAFCQTPSPD